REHLLSADVDPQLNVTDIVNVLEKEDITDCILVGHSYSGAILPGVVARAGDRVRRVVLFDSLICYTGEAVGVALGFVPKEQAEGALAAVKAGQIPPGAGVHLQQREMARQHPMDMSPERQQWLLDHLPDMPLTCNIAPVAVGAETLKGKPLDYFAASDAAIKSLHGRASELGWPVHGLKGDHSFRLRQRE